MIYLNYLLGLSIIVGVLVEATMMYRTTSCRQKAWLWATELSTKKLINQDSTISYRKIHNCKVTFLRKGTIHAWKMDDKNKLVPFEIDLKGKL